MESYKETFREEAIELLSTLETSLLQLEEDPNNSEIIDAIFRSLHTIKGSGAMAGFDNIADITHQLESAFDLLREGKIEFSSELMNLTLAARDLILHMIHQNDQQSSSDNKHVQNIIEGLKELLPKESSKNNITYQKAWQNENETRGIQTYRIRFRPNSEFFLNGSNPIPLLKELCDLGTCSILAQTDAIPLLNDINPEACYIYWDIVLTTSKDIHVIQDVFIFVENESKIQIDPINVDSESSKVDYKKLGEILLERGDISCDHLMGALLKQKRLGDLLVENTKIHPGVIDSALHEQTHVKKIQKQLQQIDQSSTIRVPAEKLDILLGLVGELVTLQVRLTQEANLQEDNTNLTSIAEEVERLTSKLRNNTMSIRMVPIGSLFNRLKRLVRDLSKELHKDVQFIMDGGDTELDKTIMDRLTDPLVHIIRNSIDHGIEFPKIRENMGKPPKGLIHLSASHSGTDVVIRISDDGAGLDLEKIRQKAIEKKIIPANTLLSEKEIISLIYLPGMSTAEEVTDISGRGVGMDVIKRSVESFHGTVEVYSQRGQGTTITIRIPLTLAIIDGFMIMSGNQHFILPMSCVTKCLILQNEDLIRVKRQQLIEYQGTVIPYISLNELFQIDSKKRLIERIVIVELNGTKIGIGVDSVIGYHQTVIKTLSKMYRNIDMFSGATVLGDGSIALILDVSKMIQYSEKQQPSV